MLRHRRTSGRGRETDSRYQDEVDKVRNIPCWFAYSEIFFSSRPCWHRGARRVCCRPATSDAQADAAQGGASRTYTPSRRLAVTRCASCFDLLPQQPRQFPQPRPRTALVRVTRYPRLAPYRLWTSAPSNVPKIAIAGSLPATPLAIMSFTVQNDTRVCVLEPGELSPILIRKSIGSGFNGRRGRGRCDRRGSKR
jgi:hypothetical protein